MAQPTLWSFVAYFLRVGALGFGGPVALANYMRREGLVIILFLKTQVVDQYHWLNNRQFLDSVAMGMMSPGLWWTLAFIGLVNFLLASNAGAALYSEDVATA